MADRPPAKDSHIYKDASTGNLLCSLLPADYCQLELPPACGLETLWKYRAENIPLSQDELDHVCGCEECLQLFGICELSKTIEEARRFLRGRLRRSG
jgi:hypothetical protein